MIAILLLCLQWAEANFALGWCPSVPVQQNFDIDRYLGHWYQKVRDIEIPYENGLCNTVDITKLSDNKMHISCTELVKGKKNTILITATCEDSIGQCSTQFFGISPNRDYRIIMTDYNNVSIVYTCVGYFLFHIKYAWILTRELGKINIEPYQNLLQEFGFDRTNLFYTNNENCN